jgi:hypothetical protein
VSFSGGEKKFKFSYMQRFMQELENRTTDLQEYITHEMRIKIEVIIYMFCADNDRFLQYLSTYFTA